MPKSATLTRPDLVRSTFGRLDVAVNDAAGMCRVERLVDLLGDARALDRREWPIGDPAREVAAVDQLHDDERVTALHAEIEDVDHVGVIQDSGRLRLLAEPRHERWIPAIFRAQHLDGHIAAQLRVVATIDRRHAALTEQLDDAVAAVEHLSDFGQTRVPLVFLTPVTVASAQRLCVDRERGREL